MLFAPSRWIFFPWYPDPEFDPTWSRIRKGLWAERAVARHLWLEHSCRVVSHRWVASNGSDIDLVMADEKCYHFLEVKFRSSGDDNPWQQVLDPDRMRRFREAIGEFLRSRRERQAAIRIDAWLVRAGKSGEPLFETYPDCLLPEVVPGWLGKRSSSTPPD